MKALNAYILTFNCARNVIEPERFASHIFDGLRPPFTSASEPLSRIQDPPEILVVALQEVAPIAYAFLGGSHLNRYYDAFLKAVEVAGAQVLADGQSDGACYRNLVTKNAGMTALMVFARSDILERIRYVETAEVGVGVQEAGNKGAVGVRIGYLVDRNEDDGIVEVAFVSAHLAPHETGCQARNDDWKGVAQRLVFELDGAENARARAQGQRLEDEEGVPLLRTSASLSRPSALYSPTSYFFVAGDFNYRTSDARPGPNDFQSFPRPTEDPNNINHFAELLDQDQLTRERASGKTFQDLLEARITFPPTYKYSIEARNASSVDPNGCWYWAKHRWPSWCDRILYHNHPSVATEAEGIRVNEYTILPLFSTSDHRAVVLSASIPLQSLSNATNYLPPFGVDTQWESKRASARRKELVVGAAAYLGLTWEGNGLLLATVLGIAATYYGLHFMLGS